LAEKSDSREEWVVMVPEIQVITFCILTACDNIVMICNENVRIAYFIKKIQKVKNELY
jgi:hypothetical protein